MWLPFLVVSTLYFQIGKGDLDFCVSRLRSVNSTEVERCVEDNWMTVSMNSRNLSEQYASLWLRCAFPARDKSCGDYARDISMQEINPFLASMSNEMYLLLTSWSRRGGALKKCCRQSLQANAASICLQHIHPLIAVNHSKTKDTSAELIGCILFTLSECDEITKMYFSVSLLKYIKYRRVLEENKAELRSCLETLHKKSVNKCFKGLYDLISAVVASNDVVPITTIERHDKVDCLTREFIQCTSKARNLVQRIGKVFLRTPLNIGNKSKPIQDNFIGQKKIHRSKRYVDMGGPDDDKEAELKDLPADFPEEIQIPLYPPYNLPPLILQHIEACLSSINLLQLEKCCPRSSDMLFSLIYDRKMPLIPDYQIQKCNSKCFSSLFYKCTPDDQSLLSLIFQAFLQRFTPGRTTALPGPSYQITHNMMEHLNKCYRQGLRHKYDACCPGISAIFSEILHKHIMLTKKLNPMNCNIICIAEFVAYECDSNAEDTFLRITFGIVADYYGNTANVSLQNYGNILNLASNPPYNLNDHLKLVLKECYKKVPKASFEDCCAGYTNALKAVFLDEPLPNAKLTPHTCNVFCVMSSVRTYCTENFVDPTRKLLYSILALYSHDDINSELPPVGEAASLKVPEKPPYHLSGPIMTFLKKCYIPKLNFHYDACCPGITYVFKALMVDKAWPDIQFTLEQCNIFCVHDAVTRRCSLHAKEPFRILLYDIMEHYMKDRVNAECIAGASSIDVTAVEECVRNYANTLDASNPNQLKEYGQFWFKCAFPPNTSFCTAQQDKKFSLKREVENFWISLADTMILLLGSWGKRGGKVDQSCIESFRARSTVKCLPIIKTEDWQGVSNSVGLTQNLQACVILTLKGCDFTMTRIPSALMMQQFEKLETENQKDLKQCLETLQKIKLDSCAPGLFTAINNMVEGIHDIGKYQEMKSRLSLPKCASEQMTKCNERARNLVMPNIQDLPDEEPVSGLSDLNDAAATESSFEANFLQHAEAQILAEAQGAESSAHDAEHAESHHDNSLGLGESTHRITTTEGHTMIILESLEIADPDFGATNRSKAATAKNGNVEEARKEDDSFFESAMDIVPPMDVFAVEGISVEHVEGEVSTAPYSVVIEPISEEPLSDTFSARIPGVEDSHLESFVEEDEDMEEHSTEAEEDETEEVETHEPSSADEDTDEEAAAETSGFKESHDAAIEHAAPPTLGDLDIEDIRIKNLYGDDIDKNEPLDEVPAEEDSIIKHVAHEASMNKALISGTSGVGDSILVESGKTFERHPIDGASKDKFHMARAPFHDASVDEAEAAKEEALAAMREADAAIHEANAEASKASKVQAEALLHGNKRPKKKRRKRGAVKKIPPEPPYGASENLKDAIQLCIIRTGAHELDRCCPGIMGFLLNYMLDRPFSELARKQNDSCSLSCLIKKTSILCGPFEGFDAGQFFSFALKHYLKVRKKDEFVPSKLEGKPNSAAVWSDSPLAKETGFVPVLPPNLQLRSHDISSDDDDDSEEEQTDTRTTIIPDYPPYGLTDEIKNSVVNCLQTWNPNVYPFCCSGLVDAYQALVFDNPLPESKVPASECNEHCLSALSQKCSLFDKIITDQLALAILQRYDQDGEDRKKRSASCKGNNMSGCKDNKGSLNDLISRINGTSTHNTSSTQNQGISHKKNKTFSVPENKSTSHIHYRFASVKQDHPKIRRKFPFISEVEGSILNKLLTSYVPNAIIIKPMKNSSLPTFEESPKQKNISSSNPKVITTKLDNN